MADDVEREVGTGTAGIRTEGTSQHLPAADGGPGLADETGQGGAEAGGHHGGMPGDGAGRRDEIGGETGVHTMESAPEGQDMPIRMGGAWGQGERGAAGYEDGGTSEASPAGTAEELREG